MSKKTGIDLCNCFAARQAARHLTRFYEREMADAKVTSAQFSILVLLDEKGETSMNAVAERMGMDRTTLLRAVKPMQRDGLVVSRRQREGLGDPRTHVLAITAAGSKRLKEATTLWIDAQRKLEVAIGAARAARLRDDLHAVSRVEIGA